MAEKYDLILVGSSFASMFFLHKALQMRRVKNVLIVERGSNNSWQWQVQHRRNSPEADHFDQHIEQTGLPGKEWPHSLGLGGSSNCWWANAMRIHPDDFQLQTKFGASVDWPITYDEIERYYVEAERIMSISGDNDSAKLFPRSAPFPQPRHRFSRVARAFKDAYPDEFFQMPQARARVATDTRNPCCANFACGQCPANAKFTVINDLAWMFKDPRVTLQLDTMVTNVVTAGGVAKGIEGKTRDGKAFNADGDIVVLGANGVYNPFILLKSGIDHGPVGKGITEQIPIYVDIDLKGLEDGDGSSFITGVGYNLMTGDFRGKAAGGFYELTNLQNFRLEKGKLRNKASVVFMLDDIPQDRNYVSISSDNPDKPRVHFEDWHPYAHAGLAHVKANLDKLFGHLPIDNMHAYYGMAGGHAHLQCSTVMGKDPATSVVDANLVHHRIRNLVVAGSGAFPTAASSNPTLTISALSLRAAEKML
jgi:choline dehydrogenase-like flavoprotein